MGGLLDALFLQRRVNDGRAEEEDQCASARVLIASQPQPLDRHIRVAPRHDRGRGTVRVVQSVRIESLRPSEVQKFRASVTRYFIFP